MVTELDQARAEIERLNEELEQRVAERTEALTTANEELRRELAEHKQVENELRRQQEILQKIFDHIPVMINFLDNSGRVKLVNREWERVLGWSLEEVVNEDLDIVSEAYPDLQRRQEAVDFINTSNGAWADFKTRGRDGRVIDTSWAVVHLLDGTAIGIGIDITERKRTERAEREQRALGAALRDAAAALNSTLDFEEVLEKILESVGRVVAHDASSIMLIETDELASERNDARQGEPRSWHVVHHRGFSERGLKKWIEGLSIPDDMDPILSRIAATGEPHVVFDTRVDPGWVPLPETEWVRSHISAPIRVKGTVIGVLNLDSSIPHFFSYTQVIRLEAFLDQAAVALENSRLLHEVQTARKRLQNLSDQLIIAQEAERRAIARELHDEIGQLLSAVGANLRVIELSPDRATRAKRLNESLNLVDDTLKQVRDLALDLRPPLLDDFGLVPALEWLIECHAERSGFSAEFVTDSPEMRVAPGIETTCYRVAQIALANVVRHAQAKRVTMKLSQNGTVLVLIIRDDGVGFDVQAAQERAARGATLGLLSMQERVRLVRGDVEIESRPGQGCEIRVCFPVDQ
ncbi:MAG TPA: PAS domain S-box protein [Chloroflexia bacterium]|nr:PAS domain S-box protein [Chloroflexia bacterium]